MHTGGGNRTQVKQPPKPRAGTQAPTDIDDDFFEGTVLASSSKGKGKAIRNYGDSNDDLSDLSAEPSTPRDKSRTKSVLQKKRALSSSPPPIGDYVRPQIEYMRKGASKFDLRDDEWMMVEDEFLETAKLFTRHLHIAEYEKLKEVIEAKKKDRVQAIRPVVVGGKMSVDGAMKKKAEMKEKRQREAIRDVFATQSNENNEFRQTASSFASQVPSINPKHPLIPATPHHTDTDDLDASRSLFQKPSSRPIVLKPKATSALSCSLGQKSTSPPVPTQDSTASFAKPTLPTTRPRAIISRRSRATPFDMLDDYVLRMNGHGDCSTPAKPTTAPTPMKAVIKEEWGSGLSKETVERIVKRKAEREKEKEGKKNKEVKLEDIPTFLV
jgi:hypothetical protein